MKIFIKLKIFPAFFNFSKKKCTSIESKALSKIVQEIARENRTLKNNLAENHLEMTLIKAELAEIKSEYENKTLLMSLSEQNQPNAIEAEQIQRQLQLL